jgi:DNA polymerase-3 subunit epsilon
VSHCSHYDILSCGGICRGTENVTQYNAKVIAFIEAMKAKSEDFFIKEKGRTSNESAIILVQDSIYKGYGFIANDATLNHIDDLMPYIKFQKNTFETQQIITSYVAKHALNILEISDLMAVD